MPEGTAKGRGRERRKKGFSYRRIGGGEVVKLGGNLTEFALK